MTYINMIKQLINYFTNNFQKYGDIFGITPHINMDPLKTLSNAKETSIFFSANTLMNAWRGILLDFFYSKKVEKTKVDNYKEALTHSELLGRLEKHITKYSDIINRVHNISRNISSNIGFIFYDKTLGIELYQLGVETVFLNNNVFLDFIMKTGAKTLIVYDILDYLALTILKDQKNLDVEIEYFIDYIARNPDKFKNPTKELKFIIQEPCILMRRLRKTDFVSKLNNIRGININRHALSGELTVCCGEFTWLVNPSITINNAIERLLSLGHYGPRDILVVCPNALYIFELAKKIGGNKLEDVNIIEISEILLNII